MCALDQTIQGLYCSFIVHLQALKCDQIGVFVKMCGTCSLTVAICYFKESFDV